MTEKSLSKYGQLCVGDKFVEKIGGKVWVKVQPGTCCRGGVANAHEDTDNTVTKIFSPKDRIIFLSPT